MSGKCTGHTEAKDKGLKAMEWGLRAVGYGISYFFFRLDFNYQNYRPIP
jgi:hypothetical protein